MHAAIVLINCDLGSEDAIIRELKTINNVDTVVGTYGVYDIVANVSADTIEDLNSAIAKIRKTPHVRATVTLIVIEGQGMTQEEEMYR